MRYAPCVSLCVMILLVAAVGCDDTTSLSPDLGNPSDTSGSAELCRPCDAEATCFQGASCAAVGTDTLCLPVCTADSDCPRDFTCEETASGSSVCTPRAGVCCIDDDGDEYGAGLACRGDDCNDGDATVFAGAEELCNGRDDDCDGIVDENVATCAASTCNLGNTGYVSRSAGTCEAGSCVGGTETPCAGYACDGGIEGTTCATTCAPAGTDDDALCADDAHCDGGSCLPDVADGEACDEGGDCRSDHCDGGLCCANGNCCLTATDCGGDVTTLCEDPASCQGVRGAPTCEAFVCTVLDGVPNDSACDTSTLARTCGLFAQVYCSGGADQTAPSCGVSCASAADCVVTATCINGECVEGAPGVACALDADCSGGSSCVDGVCCQSQCSGLCEACDVPGALGTCTLVPDGTDPGDECPLTLVCSAGACVCPGGSSESSCSDNFDNDCNGAIDCADAACDGVGCSAAGAVCTGGACVCPGGAAEVACGDTLDNDCDQATDCDDDDCDEQTCGSAGQICRQGVCACALGQETTCADATDNDCDTLIDCLDSDCDGQACGSLGEVCSAGACTCPGGGTETTCDNASDDDCDGLVDCLDGDCTGQSCGDNGVACIASQCSCPSAGPESNCSNGLDDDCDGLDDCADPDCDTVVCAPNALSDWTDCGGFAGACATAGSHSRTVTSYACLNGSCGSTQTTENGACTRTTDGASCDDGVYCNGQDTCASDSCTGHAGNPCTSSGLLCDEAAGCIGCRTTSDCPAPTDPSWGACAGFNDACDTSGTQSRTVTRWDCNAGSCVASDDPQVQACTRGTNGDPCGTTSCPPFGACGGFADTCAVDGTQARTCTDPVCSGGTCTDQPRDEVAPCTRSTDGVSCATTACSSFDACDGFSDTCDTTGSQSRSCTDYTCGGGTCGGATRVETQTCTRSTAGDSCGNRTCDGFSSCDGFSDTCDETGSQSRTCTDYTCSGDTCTPSSFTDVAGCTRSSTGTWCGAGCDGFGGCTDFSDTCDESGTEYRTCYDVVCSNGGCGAATNFWTDSRGCSRNTNGDWCGGGNWSCSGGGCQCFPDDPCNGSNCGWYWNGCEDVYCGCGGGVCSGTTCLPSCGELLNRLGWSDVGEGCCPSGCAHRTAGGPGDTYDCTYCCESWDTSACQ